MTYVMYDVKRLSGGGTVRVTREQADANGSRILEVAGTLFRQHRCDGIGAADIMTRADGRASAGSSVAIATVDRSGERTFRIRVRGPVASAATVPSLLCPLGHTRLKENTCTLEKSSRS
jgi:hypothetical protein